MAKFSIYPAIDLRGGMVVRLRQGKGDQQTNYSASPTEAAEEWINQGAEWLHVVNLDGAFGKEASMNEAAIQSILAIGKSKVKVQLGGGLRTMKQIGAAFDMGIARIVLGTAVIENPTFGEEALRRFGGEKITFGLDALGQELMSRGWQSGSGMKMFTLAKSLSRAGAKTLIYTNIQKDGMQTGVDWENAKNLSDQTGMEVIASGGTASLDDIAAVRKAGLGGVIVGRALYEGNFTLKEALNAC